MQTSSSVRVSVSFAFTFNALKRSTDKLAETSGSYYYQQMMMHDRAYVVLGEDSLHADEIPTSTIETMRDRMHAIALKHAYDFVDCCRKFRETWGHKIIPIYVVAPGWIAIFILIRDMHKRPRLRAINDLEASLDGVDGASEDKTVSRFEEYIQPSIDAPVIFCC